MTSPCIHDRIDAAYKIVASKAFAKSGTVQGSARYNFIPITQILDVVREAHAACGVKVLFGTPQYTAEAGERRWTEVRKSRNPVTGETYETRWQCANGHMDVQIIGGGPDDVIETTIGFEAQDNSDKLTNKIYTNAERCLYRTLYAIDEGEGSDPEALNIEAVVGIDAPAKPKRVPAEQADELEALLGGRIWKDGAEVMAQREARMRAIDLAEAKRELMRVYRESPGSIDRYIQMEDGKQPPAWSEEHIRACYYDLMEGQR